MCHRILIIGASGMLGHQLLKTLSDSYTILGTLRRDLSSYDDIGLFTTDNTVCGVDIRSIESLFPIIDSFKPDVVLNAAGIIKQREDGSEPVACIEINALFPHRLARICSICGARLIHFSTDCVFAGKSLGSVSNNACHDAFDVYGQTKSLGEVTQEGCLTLRTSMIGLELENKTGLIEWFLSQQGKISGYSRAIFSGLTTMELARVVMMLIASPWKTYGVYNLSAAPISKYHLLKKLSELTGHCVTVTKDESVKVNRALNSNQFQEDFNYTPPSWESMLQELATLIKTERTIFQTLC